METINTTLPIYNAKRKQLFERASSVMQANDTPPLIVCPRHRLPSFQWKDESGATTISDIKLAGKNYNGSGAALINNWVSHTFDDTFNHTLLSITQGKNVGAGGYVCTSESFTIAVGDVIRVRGTMNGETGIYPLMYLSNDAGYQFALHDGSVDFEILVRVSGTATLNIVGSGAINFSFTSVIIEKLTDIKSLVTFLPDYPFPIALEHSYFSYDGGTLRFLLDAGIYYLIIYTDNYLVYYSEWFSVDCIYDNLITSWTNESYDTFTSSGSTITSAIDGTSGSAITNTFALDPDEKVTVIFHISNSSNWPRVSLCDDSGVIESHTCNTGLNEHEFTAIVAGHYPGDYYLQIDNSAAADFTTYEIMLIRAYSEKYVTINFSNGCDLGNLYYHGGFEQTLWLVTEPMENTYPQEEEGLNNGEGQFIRTFTRQTKKYLMRTNLLPDYMVEVFNRMKLHDTVEIIDLVGDANNIYNLEVEHEWFDTDKYFVKVDLTFDYNEVFVIAGCCNNIA